MMRIKTYTSDSVPEALKMIRNDLGPGAVILKTNRTVKKRLWGLLPSMAFEITAAADPAALEEGSEALKGSEGAEASPSVLPRDKAEPRKAKASPKKRVLETYEVADIPPAPKQQPAPRVETPVEFSPRQHGKADQKWQEQFNRLSDEIQSLIRLVSHQRANDAISSLFLRDANVASGFQDLIWQGENQGLEWRKSAYAEFHSLIQEGVEESLAFLMIRDIIRNCPVDEDCDERLRIRLNKAVARMVRTSPIAADGQPKACIFIGPTGVGKTTTIAKLAARFALKDRRHVRLLTFDTYRVAATEQLRTYGDIIGIPVKVVFSIDEMEKEVESASADEILLIDTTGHSHKRIADYGELSSYVRDHAKIEKHLVLSCTTRQDDLREIVACFGAFKPDRLVFTKLDEASSFGAILNETVRSDRPLSYLTNGQDVAEDLIVPTPATIADLLVPLR
jgi:flagellar biosynthesis protein FlhF